MDNDPRSLGSGVNPLNGESPNPYAPTSLVAAAEPQLSDVEAYRTHYLRHEASVKSIGTLYYFGAVLLGMSGFSLLVVSLVQNVNPAQNGPSSTFPDPSIFVGFGIAYMSLGVLQGFAAFGLRRLRGWARNIAVVLSVIGLLGFPFITLISAYFLYLLVGKKGNVVFSDEYQNVIEQTPHIVYKTSFSAWMVALLLIVLIAAAMVGAVMG